jgi:uncharacterized delta-60 repeat protein
MNSAGRIAQILVATAAIGSSVLAPAVTAASGPGAVDHRPDGEGSAVRSTDTEPTPGRVFGAINGPRGTALVLQPGKAGVAVARYLPDGRLDRSFGTNGIALDPRSNFYLEGHLASGPGGTIVASSSEAITRFTADGRIDRSYAHKGEVLRDRSGTNIGLATNLVLRNGATIVVSPRLTVDTPLGIVAVRYGPDGRIDRRYGKDGRAFAPVWNDYEPVAAVATQARGLLMLSPGEEDGELFLTRLTPDGRVDRSFGSDGLAAGRGLRGRPIGMVQQPGGAIVVATSANQFIRFGPKGERDWSFGTRGVGVGPAPNTTLHSLVQAPDGNLIAAGAATEDGGPGGPTALAVERLTASGSADPTFGSGTGYVVRSLGPELRAGIRAALALPGGRLFLAGQVAHFKRGPFGAKIVLAGLEDDGTPATDFGVEGIVVTDAVSPLATMAHHSAKE